MTATLPADSAAGSPDFVRQITNRFESALVGTADEVSLILGADWTQRTVARPQPTGDPGVSPCIYIDTLDVEGAATIASTLFGDTEVTLGKRGEIVRGREEADVAEGSARLEADFGDGSTLAVSADGASDTRGEARVDIVAEGVAVSFTDDYRFEAREDVPTLRGY